MGLHGIGSGRGARAPLTPSLDSSLYMGNISLARSVRVIELQGQHVHTTPTQNIMTIAFG
jgi:hypothetical protein